MVFETSFIHFAGSLRPHSRSAISCTEQPTRLVAKPYVSYVPAFARHATNFRTVDIFGPRYSCRWDGRLSACDRQIT
jgi:hypothetical protein